MDVILLERIEKLGQMGDVVTVKPGFARNYLLPRKKALRATKQNLEFFEGQKKQLEADNLERRTEAEKVAAQLDGMKIIMIRSAGDSGQLYGSVTARDIAAGVTEGGVTIDRTQVVMGHPIKSLGLHDMRVALHPEVSVNIVINVARSQEEAARQAETGRAVTATEEEEVAAAAEAAAAAAELFESPPSEDLTETLSEAVADEAAATEAAPADETSESGSAGDDTSEGEAPGKTQDGP
ncbi:MAG: 50S ribosomal protein L9 [Rhodospirillales bacterium]|nr:MAG: 50S ribosomal protein L9 [Rhodospirillales bacterium]